MNDVRYIVWSLLLSLSSITEAEWKLKPMLAREGSSRPDRFNVLSDQALHIHFCYTIMDAKKITACLTRFWKIHLIFIHCVLLLYHHFGSNGWTEVMKYGPSPDLLHDILIFLRVETREAKWIFEVPKRILDLLYESSYNRSYTNPALIRTFRQECPFYRCFCYGKFV